MLCTDNAAHVAGPNGPAALLGCLGLNIAGAGGIVFGKSGRLYVSLLPVAQLSILSPGGHELLRFPDPQQNMQLDNPVNAPFNLSLDGSGRLLIADNGDPSNGYGPGQTPLPGGVDDSKSWAILAVQVHDTPGRLFRPDLPPGHGNPRPLKRPPSKNGNHLSKKKSTRSTTRRSTTIERRALGGSRARSGQERPVGGPKRGPRNLAPQDGDLVTQDDDLELLELLGAAGEHDELKQASQGDVQQ